MTRHREWTVHLGLHKTGTTHFQDILATARSHLAERQIDYVPRDALRSSGMLNVLRKQGSCRHIPTMLRRRRLASHMGDLGLAADHLLVSDENICGAVGDVFSTRPYPRLERNLRALRSLHKGKLTILIGLRNPATLLPSAYAQMIRFNPGSEPFEVLLDRWLENPPRWHNFVSRIQETLPEAEIATWSFEDYTADPYRMIEDLFSPPLAIEIQVEVSRSTLRPTSRAVEAIEVIPRRLRGSAYRSEAERLVALHASGPPFDPLNSDQFHALGRSYNDDLAAIRQMGVRWMGSS